MVQTRRERRRLRELVVRLPFVGARPRPRLQVSPVLSILGLLICGGLLLALAVGPLSGKPTLHALARELGAILVAVSVVGFILEFLGWKQRFENIILPMILDPEYVTRLTLNPEVVKERIHTLIRALYPGANIPQDVYRAVDQDVLQKIALPFRVDNHFALQLTADPVDTSKVTLGMEVRFVLHNYSHEAKPLLLDNRFTVQVVRQLENCDMASLFQMKMLKIDGADVPIEPPTWRDEWGKTMTPANYKSGEFAFISCTTPHERTLARDEAATIHYWFECKMLPVDYYVLTTGRITKGFTVEVDFKPDEFEFVEIEFGLPLDWSKMDAYKIKRPGRLVARVDRCMLPGDSFIVLWRRRGANDAARDA